MHPIYGLQRSTNSWNRIYEAVMRGNVQEGEALVGAIVELVDKNSDGEHVATQMGHAVAALELKITKLENENYYLKEKHKAKGRGSRA